MSGFQNNPPAVTNTDGTVPVTLVPNNPGAVTIALAPAFTAMVRYYQRRTYQ